MHYKIKEKNKGFPFLGHNHILRLNFHVLKTIMSSISMG